MLPDRKPDLELPEPWVKPNPKFELGLVVQGTHSGKKRYQDFTMYIYGNKKIHADSEHYSITVS